MNQKVKTIILASLLCLGFSGLVLGTVNAAPKDTVLKGASDVKQDGDTGDLPGTIQNVINTLLFITGMVAVIMIVIGGLRYVTSNGDSNQASQAKNTILYAVIGLVVAIMAYAIVNFVITSL